MAQIKLLESHPDNVEPSQMLRQLNELIMEINKVIAPLPDPPAIEPAPPGGDTGATGATGTHTGLTGTGNPNPGPLPPIHPTPTGHGQHDAPHPNQRGTHR